jgi:hypothetical protein
MSDAKFRRFTSSPLPTQKAAHVTRSHHLAVSAQDSRRGLAVATSVLRSFPPVRSIHNPIAMRKGPISFALLGLCRWQYERESSKLFRSAAERRSLCDQHCLGYELVQCVKMHVGEDCME